MWTKSLWPFPIFLQVVLFLSVILLLTMAATTEVLNIGGLVFSLFLLLQQGSILASDAMKINVSEAPGL